MTRVMPSPWFRAQARSFTVSMLISDLIAPRRLAPLTEGERALGWLILPPFQRPPVWSRAQQARFIESMWQGLPLGVYVYNRPDRSDSPLDCWLLDGQQRVTALLAYAAGEFEVLGYRFPDLGRADQRAFENLVFPALETCLDDEAECLEVYDRLAYGGTPHEPKPETSRR